MGALAENVPGKWRMREDLLKGPQICSDIYDEMRGQYPLSRMCYEKRERQKHLRSVVVETEAIVSMQEPEPANVFARNGTNGHSIVIYAAPEDLVKA